MKKIYNLLLSVVFVSFFLGSCDYLDIVPNETATEEDAFASEQAALNYLYSCYSFMPAYQNSHTFIGYAGDEIVSCFNGEPIKLYFQGGYTSGNIGNVDATYSNMYKGIRQCYLLKKNIASVPGLSEDKISDYANQADFLIAYYHSVLMQHYGPVILVKDLPDMNTSYEKMLPRSPYDECVDWVAEQFRIVSEKLPSERTGSSYGLATSVAAKALRARLLLYAASPLFNGNSEYYSDFVNHDGTLLMSQTYSKEKYKVAADAALEAINFAESHGYRLYYAEDDAIGTTTYPYPADKTQRQLRLTYVDKNGSKEVLWANTRLEEMYSIQNKSIPFLSFGGGYGPSITMLERFYTENGLPIEQDPDYEYDKRFETTTLSDDIRGEGITLKLNAHREPRFYAWISFHNGFYECQTEKTVANGTAGTTYQVAMDRSNGKGLRWLTQYKKNDNSGKVNRGNNFSPTGYLNKKGVHPGAAARKSDNTPSLRYPLPIIRLGELYLDYAEACVGYGEADYVSEGMKKLNVIRGRAGVDPVLTAWAKAKEPLTDYSSTGPDGRLMQIVRQERMIELYMETHNFWDLRRWKLGAKYFGVYPKGLNVEATTNDEFFKVITMTNHIREFRTPANYLMPIPVDQVSNNPQMVQNPGY